MSEKTKLILNMLLAVIVELPVYICLHEGGHALVLVACGAKINAFSIIGAYTSATGGTFNAISSSLLQVAGMAFPLIIAICYMLFIFNKNNRGSFYRLLSMFFSLTPIMTLLAWVFVPIAYMSGDTTNPDDVIQFLNASGINPIIIMIVSLLLFILIILLAWKKGVIQIWLELVQAKNSR